MYCTTRHNTQTPFLKTRKTFTNYNARCMMFMYRGLLIEDCIMKFEGAVREYIVSDTRATPGGPTKNMSPTYSPEIHG